VSATPSPDLPAASPLAPDLPAASPLAPDLPAASPLAPVRPRYGAGSLADVMPSVLAALGVPMTPDPRFDLCATWDPLGLGAGALAGVRRIAVLLVDGLGRYQLPLAAPYAPGLTDLAAGPGTLTLTSGFPSTTPVSLVSVGTGVAPGRHGVVGFTVRVPATGKLLNHIRWGTDPDPADWQPVPTLFERAARVGTPVTVVNRAEYAGSGLTVAAYRGADYLAAAGVDALADGMTAALRERGGLVYGYHPDLDHAGHRHGLASPEWAGAAGEVDRLVTRLAESLPADAALVITADHGQFDSPPEGRIDIDDDPRLTAGVEVVAGEPRVRYLYTLPGARDDVLATWRSILGDDAWVASRAEAIEAGWYGPVPDAHRWRIGDVVVACLRRRVVVASRSEPASVAGMVAVHGSCTAAEMEIPLIIVRGG
jgi:hypothetical protein